MPCFFAARENARQIRDQISFEMFETINDCYLFLKSTDSRKVWQDGAHAFYNKIKEYSHLFQGLTDSTFLRGDGYEFIQFGKFLERTDKTTHILDIKYHILLPTVEDVGGAVDAALVLHDLLGRIRTAPGERVEKGLRRQLFREIHGALIGAARDDRISR